MVKAVLVAGALAALAFTGTVPSQASGAKQYQYSCEQQCERRGLSGRSYSGCVDKCNATRQSR